MTRASVAFVNNDGLYVQLPASKTDLFRQGVKLTIAAAWDNACALWLLQTLYTQFPTSLNAPVFNTDKGFSRQYVIATLQNILSQLGYKGNYSGHSFWRRAATSASQSGLTEDEIMALGRWKSDFYRLYIQANPPKIWETSQKHQQKRL